MGYLRWAAKCEPKAFLHILGKLIPVQMKVDTSTQAIYHSLEEIRHDIAQRGLNMRSFGQLLLEAHQVKEREFKAGERHDSVDSNVAVVNGSAVCCDRDAPHQKDRASE